MNSPPNRHKGQEEETICTPLELRAKAVGMRSRQALHINVITFIGTILIHTNGLAEDQVNFESIILLKQST